jgi:hypothetical protein
LEAVVPNVMAAVPLPVLMTATRYARVGVLGTNCKPDAVAVLVRSSAKVGLKSLIESMIFLLSWLVKLSYVFQFLHQKNEKRPPLLRMA